MKFNLALWTALTLASIIAGGCGSMTDKDRSFLNATEAYLKDRVPEIIAQKTAGTPWETAGLGGAAVGLIGVLASLVKGRRDDRIKLKKTRSDLYPTVARVEKLEETNGKT